MEGSNKLICFQNKLQNFKSDKNAHMEMLPKKPEAEKHVIVIILPFSKFKFQFWIQNMHLKILF